MAGTPNNPELIFARIWFGEDGSMWREYTDMLGRPISPPVKIYDPENDKPAEKVEIK